jgi:hypothetical protein
MSRPPREVLRVLLWDHITTQDRWCCAAANLVEFHWHPKRGLTRARIYENTYRAPHALVMDLGFPDHHAVVAWDGLTRAEELADAATRTGGDKSGLIRHLHRLHFDPLDAIELDVEVPLCVELDWLREAFETAKANSCPPLMRADGRELTWASVAELWAEDRDYDTYEALRWRLRLLEEVLHVGLGGSLYLNRLRLPKHGAARFKNDAGERGLYRYKLDTTHWRQALNDLAPRSST